MRYVASGYFNLIIARIGAKAAADARSKCIRELTMNLRKTVIAAISAVSLVAVPTVAMAAQAKTTAVSKLSVRAAPAVRQGAAVSKASKLEGGSVVIALLAAAAIIAGIVVAADGSNKPSSPA